MQQHQCLLLKADLVTIAECLTCQQQHLFSTFYVINPLVFYCHIKIITKLAAYNNIVIISQFPQVRILHMAQLSPLLSVSQGSSQGVGRTTFLFGGLTGEESNSKLIQVVGCMTEGPGFLLVIVWRLSTFPWHVVFMNMATYFIKSTNKTGFFGHVLYAVT